MYLGRNAIAEASDRREEVVDVPEWGGKVRVLTIVGADRVEWEKMSRGLASGTLTMTEFAAHACALGIVDQDGKRVFEGADGYTILLSRNQQVLERIVGAIMRVSTTGAVEVDAALGESSGDPISGSDSASA